MASRSMLTAIVPERPVAPFDSCAAMATLPEPKSCDTTAPKLMVSEDEDVPPPLAAAVTATERLCTTAFLSGLTSSLGEPPIEPPPVSTP